MGANEKSGSDSVKVYKYAWDKYTDEELGRVFSFAEGYKAFMSKCKTERECVEEFIALAESHGYRNLWPYTEWWLRRTVRSSTW